MGILTDARKCTACRRCELACYFGRSKVFNPRKARIKVVSLDCIGFNNPVVCLLCKKLRCVEACPTGVLSIADNGVVLVDEDRCDGCRVCVEECIIGAINFDEEQGQPLICDLCNGKPVCIEWCPAGALTLNNRKRSKGEKELSYTIMKVKPLLAEWVILEQALDWYKKFI